jgi:hypothetical protein
MITSTKFQTIFVYAPALQTSLSYCFGPPNPVNLFACLSPQSDLLRLGANEPVVYAIGARAKAMQAFEDENICQIRKILIE